MRPFRATRGRRTVFFSSPTLALCFLVVGALLLISVSELIFFKSQVSNTTDTSFFTVEHPPGFIDQDPESHRLQLFGARFMDEFRRRPHILSTAIRICHWVRQQQPNDESWRPQAVTFSERLHGDIEDAFLILSAQRAGAPAVCRRFAYLMVGAAESAGMRSRVVIVANTFWKRDDGHVMTEVWIPDIGKWVLMDSMWDLTYFVDGVPASATDVYNAVHLGKINSISVHRDGSTAVPFDRGLMERRFTHLYLPLSNAFFDGYRVCFACDKKIAFEHLTTKYSPAYPMLMKQTGLYAGIASIAVGLFFSVASIRKTAFLLNKSSCGCRWPRLIQRVRLEGTITR